LFFPLILPEGLYQFVLRKATDGGLGELGELGE
jgi:hypothetical protein